VPLVPSSRRQIGLPGATALVVSSMIGTGVFTTSGFALELLGRPGAVLVVWAIGGLIATCGAIGYGALARRFSESGGEYALLSRTVHPLAGFLAGWVSLLAGFTAPIAASALALQAYLAGIVQGWAAEWLATAAILAAALLHGVRVRVGVAFQVAAVGIELALIAAFLVLGAWALPPPHPIALSSPGVPAPGAFAVALVWVSFAYSGWNAAIYVAGELRDPERDITRALLLGTVLVTALYVALNAVFLAAAPPAALAGAANVAAVAAQAIGGPRLRVAVALLVALALFASLSGMMLAGPRVYARMAEDGYLPRLVAAGGDAPAAAVALQAGLAVVVVWVATLAELLSYIGFTLGLSAAATVASLIALRRREGPARLPVPGYPVTPAAFIVVTLAISGFLIAHQPREALLGLLTVASGLPMYWLRPRRRPSPNLHT
jgi:APA family basic amino acid/polyamine antiporter